jgi:hypothetical protein
MLGVLRMDVQTCSHPYIELASKIFPVENILAKSRVGKTAKALIDDTRLVTEESIRSSDSKFQETPHYPSAKCQYATLLSNRVNIDYSLESSVLLPKMGGIPWRFRNFAIPWAYTDDCEYGRLVKHKEQ